MATNSLQAQRYTPKPQAQQQQQQPSVRNQNQTSGNFQQSAESRNKVRIKKLFLWFRENFFPIISDYDSESEDEEERQAIKEERKLLRNPPIIKPELRVRYT